MTLKESLSPLEPFKNRTLTLHGVCDRVRGDGDAHMRGMGCLLTGVELFPGNVQGGSDTPAGWARGISIDQEIKNHLQRDPASRTRFGSLEFGVMVPNRADTWTRMVYTGRQPADRADRRSLPDVQPGSMAGCAIRTTVGSVLDDLRGDLQRLSGGPQRRGSPAARTAYDLRARDGAGPARQPQRGPRGAAARAQRPQ